MRRGRSLDVDFEGGGRGVEAHLYPWCKRVVSVVTFIQPYPPVPYTPRSVAQIQTCPIFPFLSLSSSVLPCFGHALVNRCKCSNVIIFWSATPKTCHDVSVFAFIFQVLFVARKPDDGRQVYSQLEAEGSNNDLLSKAYGIINNMLEGVTSMSMDYSGQGYAYFSSFGCTDSRELSDVHIAMHKKIWKAGFPSGSLYFDINITS